VLGLEAVLADGSVVRRLSGLPKDNSGYDLTQLMVGSEGTLGVITAVLLRLVPTASRRTTALLGVPGLAPAVQALSALRADLPGLDAAEFFLRDGLGLVQARSRAADPLDRSWAAYLLVDVAEADPEDVAPVLAAVLDRIGGDAVLAQTPTDRRRLWELREGHTEAVNAAGVPVKLDVAVPVAALAGFVEGLPQLVAAVAPSARVVVFGHLAEGNVHVNLLGAVEADMDGAVTDAVLRRVAELGGSISAEHGIGRSKRRWLPLTRGPADLAAMRAVKAALDPAEILSPGRVLP
jgi:FAD/FMN-containing dehydrogenase